ncbi:MAG: hypothetical protein JWQ09_2433 [Segetibacter sp.]|nr:hypothetical protein [Segetibacter sp.]
MSYDLYFYKRKKSTLSEKDVRTYLADNLTEPNEQNNQWWFENEDTGVYFCFETTDEKDFENYEELFESFTDFDNTRFLFNVNFVRPNFFGIESFLFVEKFIRDLDLYVLNLQSETNADNPYKPETNELYENWSTTNLSACVENFSEESYYYPLKETNEIWEHNYNRLKLQAEHDEVYYVPCIYLLKEFKTGKLYTQTSWTSHIPNIFPKTDYILLWREKKKLFKTIEEFGLISYETFIKVFGEYLDDFSLPNYKIIHPDNAEKASDLFNNIKFEQVFKKFGERVSWDYLYNAKL